jgi:hypothetical protein
LTVEDFRPGPNNDDAADGSGNRWPNIIVEVAFSETEEHVLAKAEEWLNTAQNPDHGVQQVIVIKLEYPGLTDGHRRMKAWRYERGADDNPVQEIEFGNHGPDNGATQPGIPGMQLHIPISSLYLPLPVPDGVGEALALDLFHIRRRVERAL